MHSQQKIGGAAVQVSLELDASLNQVLTTEPFREAVRTKVASELDILLGVLGIPGRAQVQIGSLEGKAWPEHSLRVSVNRKVCGHSQTLLERVVSYISDEAGKTLDSWFNLEPDVEKTADLFALICVEIIKAQPARLFGIDQAVEYSNRLKVSTEVDTKIGSWPADPAWLHVLLSKVIELGISIADHQKVAQVTTKGLAEGRSIEDLAEDLISALRPKVLEVHLPLNYLKELTSDDPTPDGASFSLIRDGIFYELGLRLPELRFVIVDDLRPQSFRFRINHLTTLARIGLPRTQYLANDIPDRLKLHNIEGKSFRNPANRNENTLIDASSVSTVEALGIYCWSPIGYLILSLGHELRIAGESLIHRDGIQTELEQLELAFPALVETVRSSFSVEQITRVLRSLLAERISIRSLKLILERMVEYDYILTDTSEYMVFDDRLPINPDHLPSNVVHLASFVRMGMKRYLKYQHAPHGFLSVYVLDSEIERIISQHGIAKRDGASLNDNERQKILNAVHPVFTDTSGNDQSAVILTNIQTRPLLHEILSPEVPEHVVLAYEELASDLSIQIIERISLAN